MTHLAALRHVPTDWNLARRLQGRADMPLSRAARADLAGRAVPVEFRGFRSLCSPLRRAQETARRLGFEPELDQRLIEMDWGEFEGRELADLRLSLGEALARNEALGLDFRPPGGESPRDVQVRLDPLLRELAAGGRPTLAFTHGGVIRALYARASGWDMTGPAPDRLDLTAIQLFSLDRAGCPRLERLNIPLVDKPR